MRGIAVVSPNLGRIGTWTILVSMCHVRWSNSNGVIHHSADLVLAVPILFKTMTPTHDSIRGMLQKIPESEFHQSIRGYFAGSLYNEMIEDSSWLARGLDSHCQARFRSFTQSRASYFSALLSGTEITSTTRRFQ